MNNGSQLESATIVVAHFNLADMTIRCLGGILRGGFPSERVVSLEGYLSGQPNGLRAEPG